MALDPNRNPLEVRKKGSKFAVGNRGYGCYASFSSRRHREAGISTYGELRKNDSRYYTNPTVISTPSLIDESHYLHMIDTQRRDPDRPTSKADDIMDTVTPLVQATNNSNTALQKGESKTNQCSESEVANYLDPRQPEIGTKSPDEMTSESAANIGYPERSFLSHARDQLISTLTNRERPPANQDSKGPEYSRSDSEHVPLLPGLHGQSKRMEPQHTQGSSDLLANAGDRECLIPYNVITETERVDYAEDLMQSIRSRVLGTWEARQSTKLALAFFIPCNVREFMEKQFAGSNKSLGRVITISGTATCGQATTCSDYISSNWPLRGLWLLDVLQDAFDAAKSNAEGKWPF